MKSKKKSTSTIAIRLKQVSKKYTIHHFKPTFVENLLRRETKETHVALQKVTLVIHKGEKVGIIGPNGSGKTTLLKLIVGITQPTQGVITTHGKVVSLIDLEAGFHPDLSGEENIYLNGLVIGMSKKEIAQKFSQIVAFADIGKFIDAPIYTYSSGMKLRLGFAVAIHSDPDILVLDEGLAVGDQYFQKKIDQKIREFVKADKTVLIVSHWIEYLKKNTKRILWFESAKLKADGDLRLLQKYKNLLQS